MKKLLSVLLTLCLFVNVSFAFDPYADEEVEKKSYKKLYYGIALTLLGGFLAYDGFSEEKVDVSKPRVDYLTVSHSEWVQRGSPFSVYELRSGLSLNNVPGATGDYEHYEIDGKPYLVEENVLYNNGNVDLKNIEIEVRYKFSDGTYIGPEGQHLTREGYYIDEETHQRVYIEKQGYHTAETNKERNSTTTKEVKTAVYKDINLAKGESITWQDVWSYPTANTNSPDSNPRSSYVPEGHDRDDGTTGLHLGKNSAILMDVRVKLKKNQQYTPIYEKRHKSDLEGVAGIFVGLAGIYFIVDHFVDMHKFNVYAKKHHLNFRVATASNEYKLMLQKRI